MYCSEVTYLSSIEAFNYPLINLKYMPMCCDVILSIYVKHYRPEKVPMIV